MKYHLFANTIGDSQDLVDKLEEYESEGKTYYGEEDLTHIELTAGVAFATSLWLIEADCVTPDDLRDYLRDVNSIFQQGRSPLFLILIDATFKQADTGRIRGSWTATRLPIQLFVDYGSGKFVCNGGASSTTGFTFVHGLHREDQGANRDRVQQRGLNYVRTNSGRPRFLSILGAQSSKTINRGAM